MTHLTFLFVLMFLLLIAHMNYNLCYIFFVILIRKSFFLFLYCWKLLFFSLLIQTRISNIFVHSIHLFVKKKQFFFRTSLFNRDDLRLINVYILCRYISDIIFFSSRKSHRESFVGYILKLNCL